MLEIVLAGLVLLVVGAMAVVASRQEIAPKCRECEREVELVAEEYEQLGGGWLQGERVYCCPRCQALLSRQFVIGPSEWLDAA